MAVVTRDSEAADPAAGTSRPAAVSRFYTGMVNLEWLTKAWWTILSISLFAGIWEMCWFFGWADPKLLPPPGLTRTSKVDIKRTSDPGWVKSWSGEKSSTMHMECVQNSRRVLTSAWWFKKR